MGKWLNCIFSLTTEVMWTIFGSYDHLMIVYPVYVFDDQWPFCLVSMATFNFEKGLFSNDNFKTTEALWLLFGIKVAWVRAVQNRYNYGSLPLGYVAMATESSHWLIMGKWLNCIFMPCHKKWQVYYVILSEILSVCPGKHPRFRGYFGHNYEVFWGLFHLNCIS